MNINLGDAKKKQTKASSIGYGLNNRGAKEAAKKKSNVFDDDDDDDDSDDPDNNAPKDEDLSGREQVNQQIAKEQAALRVRAQAAAAAIKDPSIYDYDGAYDSFNKPQDGDGDGKPKVEEKDRKSRYIGDLLSAAKKRERERDAIHERKVAREQAEEDAHEDFRGKEKFVTKAYKRKLEERKRWEAEEEEQRKTEEENDVTKKTDGAALGNFYGNFSRNVAMGGGILEETNEDKEKTDEESAVDDPMDEVRKGPMDDFAKGSSEMDFLDGFAKSDGPGGAEDHANASPHQDEVGESRSTAKEIDSKQPPSDGLSMRERREKKVAEARVRYLERRQLMLQ
jgi:coiled-coil domain-containing protein 55